VKSLRHITRADWSFATLTVALISLPYSKTVCHVALIAFLLQWASEGDWSRKLLTVKNNVLLLFIILFVAMQLLALTYAADLQEGWLSIEKKLSLLLVTVAIATTAVRFSDKQIRLAFYFFAATCLAGAVVCLVYASLNAFRESPGIHGIGYLNSSAFTALNPEANSKWLFFSYTALSAGVNIHPTYFSLYICFSNVFLLTEVLDPQKQIAKAYKIIIISIIIFFTVFIVCLSSRIMIFCMLATYAAIIVHPLVTARKAAVVVACFVMVIILGFINPVSRYRGWQEIGLTTFAIKTNHQYKTSTEMRVSLWWLGWQSYLATNPIVGAGTGEVKQRMKTTSETYGITNVLETYDPHNQYLYTLIAHGLIGLIILMLSVLVPLILAWRIKDYLLTAFLFCFALLLLTESALEIQKGIVFFSIVYSLLVFQRHVFQIVPSPFNLARAKS
jgi:hypothetical protein